jgi:hypothetical protein
MPELEINYLLFTVIYCLDFFSNYLTVILNPRILNLTQGNKKCYAFFVGCDQMKLLRE